MTSTVGEQSGIVAEPVDAGATVSEPEGPGSQTTVAAERPQHARRRRNRRRTKWSLAALVVVVLLAGGYLGAQRIGRSMAQPVLTSGRHSSSVVHGTAPALPWPPGGQAAIAIPSLGYARQSGPELPVPVASLTKMATAVVILRDHPVASGSSGPPVTVTADDAHQFDVDLQDDETNIPLQAGETLTEVQLLEALLNRSANDVAYSLAVWDAGSEAAFVVKMNSMAASLGAAGTHFVDASGFQPQSVSTAADTLRIAAAGMAMPTFARIAGQPSVTLPLVGTVPNVVTEIGSHGVVGVKSGFTSQASGCMVLAGYRTIGGRAVLVLASALGQHVQTSPPAPSPPAGAAPSTASTTTLAPYDALEAQYPLRYAGPLVEHLLDVSESAVVAAVVARPGDVLGMATATWGGSPHRVPAVATHPAVLLGIPGQRVVVETRPPTTAVPAGSDRAGKAVFTLGTQTVTVPLRRLHDVADPTWSWKLLHG